MSITVEFYNSFKPIYSKDKEYLGANNSPVIENVELNDKLNKKQYEYNNYDEFRKELTNNKNKNIKSYLRENHYYVKVTFDDGGTYEGQINEKGECDGIGKDIIIINEKGEKDTYIGEFKKDKRDGCGIMNHSDGDKYEGEFKENKKNGKGVYTWLNGNKYEGDFKQDLRDGKGKITWKDGRTYEGEFEKDKKNGKGKITWKDGSTYKGDFNNHGESSTGTLTIDNSPQQWNFPMSNINIYCKPPKKICKIPFTERTHLMKHQPSKWSCCNYSCVEETREPEKNL